MNLLLSASATYHPTDIAKYNVFLILSIVLAFIGISLISIVLVHKHKNAKKFKQLSLMLFIFFIAGVIFIVGGIFCLIAYVYTFTRFVR